MPTLPFMTNPPATKRNLLPTSTTLPSQILANLTLPLQVHQILQALQVLTKALLPHPHLNLQEATPLAALIMLIPIAITIIAIIMEITMEIITIITTMAIAILKAAGHHLNHQVNLLALQVHHQAHHGVQVPVQAVAQIPMFGVHHLPLHPFPHQLQAPTPKHLLLQILTPKHLPQSLIMAPNHLHQIQLLPHLLHPLMLK